MLNFSLCKMVILYVYLFRQALLHEREVFRVGYSESVLNADPIAITIIWNEILWKLSFCINNHSVIWFLSGGENLIISDDSGMLFFQLTSKHSQEISWDGRMKEESICMYIWDVLERSHFRACQNCRIFRKSKKHINSQTETWLQANTEHVFDGRR